MLLILVACPGLSQTSNPADINAGIVKNGASTTATSVLNQALTSGLPQSPNSSALREPKSQAGSVPDPKLSAVSVQQLPREDALKGFSERVHFAELAAIFGGLASLLVNFVFNVGLPRLRRWNLTRHIRLITESTQDGFCRCRLYNGGFWTMSQATIYIRLEFRPTDVVQGQQAFIQEGNAVPLEWDALCWSVRVPKPHPMRVDIFAKETQQFNPCLICGNMITIPSEEGWPSEGSKTIVRVCLQRKKYTGVLKVVSADTDARFFDFVIDPDDQEPFNVEPARNPKRYAPRL
jgi:hypothetical protein